MSYAPTRVEIDIDAFERNLRTVTATVADTASVCAVIKADAYGHGVRLVVPSLVAAGIDMIGVADNAEAEEARNLGFGGRILRVRTATPGEVEDGLPLQIEEWVGGLEHALMVSAIAQRSGTRVSVHASVNSSGLGRDGIELSTSGGQRALEAIFTLPGLLVVGICDHLPVEDVDDIRSSARTFEQQVLASTTVRSLRAAGALQLHCATTYAAFTVPSSRLDLVRIGAALYGETDVPSPSFDQVMTLRSEIAAVNEYPPGSTVGYSRSHMTDRAARLASVPIGYADGYHRALGGRTHALVDGRRVPIVDKLAMNTLILDVTEVPAARPGTEVVLYGRQGDERITADELGRANGALAADLYSAWGRVIPRVAVPAPLVRN